jgi:hypothetical protein
MMLINAFSIKKIIKNTTWKIFLVIPTYVLDTALDGYKTRQSNTIEMGIQNKLKFPRPCHELQNKVRYSYISSSFLLNYVPLLWLGLSDFEKANRKSYEILNWQLQYIYLKNSSNLMFVNTIEGNNTQR